MKTMPLDKIVAEELRNLLVGFGLARETKPEAVFTRSEIRMLVNFGKAVARRATERENARWNTADKRSQRPTMPPKREEDPRGR